MAEEHETHIGTSALFWGILWRSVVWYTVAGAVLGGLYGCAVVVSAFFTPGVDEDGWVWALRRLVIFSAAAGFVVGWVLARVVGREMRPSLGAVIGALAGITQGGSYLMFAYLFAFPWGAILGGIYGLAVGLVDALLVAAVTRALYFPLSEPAKHRRAVVMASVLGVLIVPGYWFVSLLRSSGYEGFNVSGSVTGSFWGDAFIYTGFPPLLLALVAQWLGTHLAGWYEREAPRASVGSPAEAVLARALRNSRTVRRALFGILALVMLLMLASGVGVYRNRTILVDVPGGSVDLSPNGGRVAVLSPSRFEVVGVDERRTLHAISLPRAGTTDVDANVWSTNGKLLALYDGSRVKVYDVAKGEEAAELPAENVSGLAWSENGSVLAAGIEDPYDYHNEDTDPVLIWDGHDDEWSDSLPVEARNGLSEGPMALSPDGRTLATCDYDSIQLWDVESERLLRDIRTPGDGLSADYSVTLLSFDGELIAAGGSGGEVSVWRVRDGNLLWTEVGHDRDVTALAFSPDGDLLVSGGIDGKVKLWRSRDGDLLQAHVRPAGYTGEVLSVAFNPKKERVISIDRADGYVRIWPRQTPSFFERLMPQ